MRKLLAFALLCLTGSCFGTTPVTGVLRDPGTNAVSSGAFVRAILRGCSSNAPRVSGVALIPPHGSSTYYVDFAPDASGIISGTLYSTRDAGGTGSGEIQCGGSTTSTWYGIIVFFNGVPGPELPVHAKNGATLDLTNVTPITTTPVVTAPTGDSTYARLDAGNQPFTGRLQQNGGDLVVSRTTADTLTNKTLSAATSIGGLSGLGFHQQIFMANGTFTIPTGITQVKLTVVGAGGAGGGGTNTTLPGSGGGGGVVTLKWLSALTPGNTLAVTIGAGGTGVSGAGGNNGGTSSVASGTQTITTVSSSGGFGGSASAGPPGAGGNTSNGGDFALPGGAGSFGNMGAFSGNGGGSFLIGGGPLGVNGNTAGNAGGPNSGQGGSGGGGTGGNTTGGAGAAGLVIFEWLN